MDGYTYHSRVIFDDFGWNICTEDQGALIEYHGRHYYWITGWWFLGCSPLPRLRSLSTPGLPDINPRHKPRPALKHELLSSPHLQSQETDSTTPWQTEGALSTKIIHSWYMSQHVGTFWNPRLVQVPMLVFGIGRWWYFWYVSHADFVCHWTLPHLTSMSQPQKSIETWQFGSKTCSCILKDPSSKRIHLGTD